MMTRRNRERGAVALITTIIISILLTIITTGLITVMIAELRQSNDAEQSVRAYYAAQSGVEEGIRKVIAALPGQATQLCGAVGSQNVNLDPASPGAVGWTCQQITYSGSPSGSLPLADKATQVDVGSISGPAFQSVKLEWDLTPKPSGGFPASFFNAPATFPAAGSWNSAAALEVAIIDYPAAAFDAATAAISLRNVVAIPRTGGGGTISYASLKQAAGTSNGSPAAGTCNAAAASYHCSLIITNMPSSGGRGYTFRLRSRYVGTDYKMTFFTGVNGTGTVVNVPDGTATIDITAKAGDAFRRVVYKIPYQKGAASGLDYVIYGEGDICKNFAIFNGVIDPTKGSGCPYP